MDRRRDPWTKRLTGRRVGGLEGHTHELVGPLPNRLRKPDRRHAGGRVDGVPVDQHEPLAGERRGERPPSQREEPAEQLRPETLAF